MEEKHLKLCPKSDGYTDCHCSTKHCKHYESDFDKFIKVNCCAECITPASGAPDETQTECLNGDCKYCHKI